MLDIVCVLGVSALFALVGLIGTVVEKLRSFLTRWQSSCVAGRSCARSSSQIPSCRRYLVTEAGMGYPWAPNRPAEEFGRGP